MEGYDVICTIALGLLMDVAMAYAVWRWVLCRPPRRRRRRRVGVFASPFFGSYASDSTSGARFADDVPDVGMTDRIRPLPGDDRFTYGWMFNPATGLPMMDDTFDAAGNPYGADLHVRFDHECGDFGSNSFDPQFETFGASDSGSDFDSFGSDCFSSGLGGMHDW